MIFSGSIAFDSRSEFKSGERTVPSLWAGSIWNPAHDRRNNHINCLSLTDERVIRSWQFIEMD
jgi:hypothetical protein